MIDSDFILHYALYFVPLFWCGTVLYIYKKVQDFYKEVQRSILFSLFFMDHPNFWYGLEPSFMFRPLVWAWAELYVPTSGMGLGRALCPNFWYGLGPNLIYPFYKKGWAILFVGLFYILISPPPLSLSLSL